MAIGRYIASSELVPGDIYEVTDPSLTQFPCDSLLLSGDCIVNESMLTGKGCGRALLSFAQDAHHLFSTQESLCPCPRFPQPTKLYISST